jgi:hypothetical protein
MKQTKSPVQLVTGYLPKIDQAPSDGARLDEWFRVAIILDTYRADLVDADLDPLLYKVALASVWSAVEATSASLPSSDRKLVTFDALWHEWEAGNDSGEPFQKLAMEREGTCVARLSYEPWWKVGGPEPYHDSVTIVVYTENDIGASIEEALRRETGRSDIEILRGERKPPERSVFLQMWNRVFRS